MSSISLSSNVGLDDTATNDDTSTVGEPSVAVSGGQVFVTGNWYASRSADGGSSWTHVDPFTTLPAAAGGFCCDQVTVRDDARGVWIWVLQYIAQNGANVFRLAATHDLAGGGWYWWDIAPTTLDPAWTGQWFDYPDIALTDDNVFLTFNVFDRADRWQRASVMRFPLQTVADGGTLGFQSWSTTEHGSLRLTQGARSTMYWGSHTTNRRLRVFGWADGQDSLSWWDVDVTSWSGAISSTAPNGVDWLARCDPRITAGAVGGGAITFAWTAGSGGNRPHAHARVVRIDEASKQRTEEPDLWSEGRAWAYPVMCPNDAGHVGLSAFYGGADRHPGLVVGARGPTGAWTTAYARQGSHSPNEGKWGDYLTCRLDAPSRDSWVAAGFTMEGGESRQSVEPRVVRFALVT